MTGLWSEPAPAALARYAPEPAAALRRMIAATPAGTRALSPLAAEYSDAPDAPDADAATEFAEQFYLDVSAIGADERGALFAELGADAPQFVMGVYVADWAPRVRRALDALFAPDPEGWPSADAETSGAVWPEIEEWLQSVARLREVDPVTTELVRLRGARQHNCRMCKSLRSVPALAAGADEAMFDAVDDYADSTLPDRQKAALALVDALIWQPGHLPAEVLDDVRTHFSPAEAVELVLDIARNASNKISVSLGSDAANVEDGVQTYEVRADGTIDFDAVLP